MGDYGELADSPRPVMTFEVRGRWLAVRVEQVERVAMAPRLWPVPLAWPEHVGLLDTGQELIPVLRLDLDHPVPPESAPRQAPPLVAILHVRGEAVGLAVDKAGRVFDRYRVDEAQALVSPPLLQVGAVPAIARDSRFWLVDADRLFVSESPGATHGSATV